MLADKAVPVSDISIDMATAQLEALSEAWDKADKTDTSRLVVLQDQIQAVRAEIEAGSAS